MDGIYALAAILALFFLVPPGLTLLHEFGPRVRDPDAHEAVRGHSLGRPGTGETPLLSRTDQRTPALSGDAFGARAGRLRGLRASCRRLLGRNSANASGGDLRRRSFDHASRKHTTSRSSPVRTRRTESFSIAISGRSLDGSLAVGMHRCADALPSVLGSVRRIP